MGRRQLLILVGFGFLLLDVILIKNQLTHDTDNTVEALEHRVTAAEKTMVMLNICFPDHHYKADAAPTCPAFKLELEKKLNQPENI